MNPNTLIVQCLSVKRDTILQKRSQNISQIYTEKNREIGSNSGNGSRRQSSLW